MILTTAAILCILSPCLCVAVCIMCKCGTSWIKKCRICPKIEFKCPQIQCCSSNRETVAEQDNNNTEVTGEQRPSAPAQDLNILPITNDQENTSPTMNLYPFLARRTPTRESVNRVRQGLQISNYWARPKRENVPINETVGPAHGSQYSLTGTSGPAAGH